MLAKNPKIIMKSMFTTVTPNYRELDLLISAYGLNENDPDALKKLSHAAQNALIVAKGETDVLVCGDLRKRFIGDVVSES